MTGIEVIAWTVLTVANAGLYLASHHINRGTVRMIDEWRAERAAPPYPPVQHGGDA